MLSPHSIPVSYTHLSDTGQYDVQRGSLAQEGEVHGRYGGGEPGDWGEELFQ